MSRSQRLHVCLRCQNLKPYEARGLCKCCYNHVREGRTAEHLDDYPLLGEGDNPNEPLTYFSFLKKGYIFRRFKNKTPGQAFLAGLREK